jgi:tRNA1(Val) A37 N6-methylase TrmN6
MTEASEIHVLNQKVRLLQPARGFRTSMDSVLLAAASPAKRTEKVLDLGCGVGGASFCLLWREPNLRLTGIDIQEEYIHLAQQNARLNQCSTEVHFKVEDVRNYRCCEDIGAYDHIICNPPFYEAGHHTLSPQESLAKSRGHTISELDLKDWIDSAFHNLKSKGSLTLIHQASQMDRLIQYLGKRFRRTDIFPIYSKVNEPAKRVIIRAFKDRHSPLTLHPGIIMHTADGSESPEARLLLRDGIDFDTLLTQ